MNSNHGHLRDRRLFDSVPSSNFVKRIKNFVRGKKEN